MRPFGIDEGGGDEFDRELSRLHEELDSIRIEERPSFGPELRTELERVWVEAPRSGPRWPRQLIAASVGALFLVGLSVPAANGALARFLEAVQGHPQVVEENAADEAPAPRADAAPPAREPERSVAPAPPPAPSLDLARGDTPEPVRGTTFPELLDREASESLVERYYPDDLQAAGIGGTVWLRLWVDRDGRVAEAEVARTSGFERLDRAAVVAAPRFRFVPATRLGDPVATWVEIPVVFEPPAVEERPLPPVRSPTEPEPPDLGDLDIEPEWSRPAVEAPAPYPSDARGMLLEAMGEEATLGGRWSDVDGLLSGEPPAHELPLRWRDEAVEALEGAIVRNPTNPAPFLALGRIRMKQGLRTDARRLFERGIERAEESPRAVPPRVIADLHYERGLMIRESWLPWSGLGRVPSVAVAATRCSRAPLRPPPSTYATGETLIAWNYLCPGQFDRLMEAHFESVEALKEEERLDMLRSFSLATYADPGHVGANVELLLSLADEARWEEFVEEAARFARQSGRHPYALLLAGLGLHRTGHANEAMSAFEEALSALPSEVSVSLQDVSLLRGSGDALPWSDSGRQNRAFWNALDPLLSSPVNEREVEHLARAAYAFLRFGATDTDAARVWIRYGRPEHARSVGAGRGLRTVFWDYGPGPDFTFRRAATSLAFDLTTEGEAYLDELGDVFPHRYDGASDAVAPLPAQLARFRADDPGRAEIEVHFSVPGGLLESGGDSLSLGVFFLGEAGQRWTVRRSRLPAMEAPVHLQAVVPEGANRLVVEVLDPISGLAAALRSPVSSTPPAGAPALSDLLLVEPDAPFSEGEVRRSASWLQPRTDPGQPASGAIGVLFDLYDVASSEQPYVMRMELEELATGRRHPVEFRPAGELETRFVWDRRTRRSARTTEYAVLALDEMPKGSFLLRVVVELPETGERLETSRALLIA